MDSAWHKPTSKTDFTTTFLKPIPPTTKELYKECQSLGLLHLSLEKPRAKLLSHIYASRKIGRSSNQASILLVGSSGVGKSSTINHLLQIEKGIQFANTHASRSETRTTSEFILRADGPQYEVKGLQLGLVDTPGFNDVEGTKQDACNFYSIKMFYKTHENLSGCFPNLIFIVVPATDTRIQGPNSNLSKSLRCLKQLGLVDHSHPNVVAILSFCCSIPYKNVAKWSEKMETKKTMIQEVIFQALHVTAPVILIENDYGEDGADLEAYGKFTRLPNRVLQPLNFYNACAEILIKNADSLGLIILNACFAKEMTQPPITGHKVAAKNAFKDKLDSKEERFLSFFEQTARGAKDPIFDIAQQYIEKKELKPTQQQEIQELASTLKRMGIEEKSQCASITEGSVEYFHADTISSTGEDMLKEEFAIPKKAVGFGSGRLIGQGYNIFNDKPMPCQIMDFNTRKSTFGIVVPTCAKFEVVNETHLLMDQFKDEQSYTQSRLKNLNLGLKVESKMFNVQGETKAGFNKSSDASEESSATEYSFLLEQRMFELKLANYEEYIKKTEVTFTLDFKSAVEKLPKQYDESSEENRSSFERFFNRFGHFVVSSAYGGGSVEIKVTSQKVGNKTQSFEEIKAALLASIDAGLLSTGGEASGGYSSTTSVSSKSLLGQSTMRWFGGNRHLHTKNTVTQREEMLKWKTSLLVNPAMLNTTMTLEPISTLIACVAPEKDNACHSALKDSLGGEFKVLRIHKPPGDEKKSSGPEPDNPENSVIEPEQRPCFPSKSLVLVNDKNGSINQKQMVDLRVGDKLVAWDTKRHRVISSEVILFAHWQPNAAEIEYLTITLQDRNSITLSGNHLVMTGKHCEATMAQNIQLDHVLYTIDERGALSPKKVVAVEKTTEPGLFCPITKEGNLFVDNVLASCYASVNNHAFLNGLFTVSAQNVAHLGLMPMRILRKFHCKWVSKIPKDEHVHPYIKWLCKLKLPWMDGELVTKL